jgi:ferredoxin
MIVASVDGPALRVAGARMTPGRFASGDYYCQLAGEERGHKIVANTEEAVTVDGVDLWAKPPSPGTSMCVRVRLQRPVVDPGRCIGCGICEHECPVSGLRAIRVTADNETRSARRSVLLKSFQNPQPATPPKNAD